MAHQSSVQRPEAILQQEEQNQQPPTKEIRTVMRDGDTFREEYEHLNPDGTVTKTIRTGDRNNGVRSVEVYKMDKSGIVRRVSVVNPTSEQGNNANNLQQQINQGNSSSNQVVPQIKPDQMEHIVQLREHLRGLNPDQRIEIINDYKKHLLDYGTKKLQKNLSKKFDKVYQLTDKQVEQLINHGIEKLRHTLNKSLDEEFIPLVMNFPENQTTSQQTGESKINNNPVSFRIKPTDEQSLGERNSENSSNIQRPVSFTIRPENILRRYSKPISSPEQKSKDTLGGHSGAKQEALETENRPKHHHCSGEKINDSDKLLHNVHKLERGLKNYLKEDNIKDKSTKEEFSDLEDAYKNIKKLMKQAREKEAYEEWRELEEELQEDQERKERLRYEKERRKQERDRLKEQESYSDLETPLNTSLNKFIKKSNEYPGKENSKQQNEYYQDFNRQQNRLYTPLSNDMPYKEKQNDQRISQPQDTKQYYTVNTQKEQQDEEIATNKDISLPKWLSNVIKAVVNKNPETPEQYEQPQSKESSKANTIEVKDKEMDFNSLLSNIWNNTMNLTGLKPTTEKNNGNNEQTQEPRITTNLNPQPIPQQDQGHKPMNKESFSSRVQPTTRDNTRSGTGSTFEIPRERSRIYHTQPAYRIDRVGKPSETNQTIHQNTNTNNDKSVSFNVHPKTYSQESQQQSLNNPRLQIEQINVPEETSTPWWFENLAPPVNENFISNDDFIKPIIKQTVGDVPNSIGSFFNKPGIEVKNFASPMLE